MMMQVRASTLWASDPLGAIAGYGEALPVQRAVGNANLLASALCNLAVFQAAVGQVADAERAAREALDLSQPGQRAAKPMLGFAWRALAEVAYERGDEVSFAESCGWFEELSVHGVVAARRAGSCWYCRLRTPTAGAMERRGVQHSRALWPSRRRRRFP